MAVESKSWCCTCALALLTIPIIASYCQLQDPVVLYSSMDHSSSDLGVQDFVDESDNSIPLPVITFTEKITQSAMTQEALDGAVYGRPLQLLKPGGGHDRLELNVLAVEKLAAISDPVSLVSAVGPYHGGKSFLLNVLLNSTHGFDVGAVPEPETRGIWMRMVPKDKMSGVDGSVVVLLDTEGFYGEGATRSYDARIFALATLLSSHLVYNTLRTLGDSQSVSALADLAKQAQVFNLQNWLHTGYAISDHGSSSPLDMNPVMLLKTLKFPPLTWVVQGFDIGLQSSNTPMDHLQRYLAAHAHTGDRTLDTLFTEGIKCHTLRTPTDLNLLRQVVGDEGLAAREELYPYLHPAYLADVEALRKTVFGNLASKANFTGKDLAVLLPVLVHYVNEDFPLNAERKLRDVLVDVVVDGAFSGGVQYFQLCMQTLPDREEVLSRRRGQEVDVVNAKLESAEGGAKLSALAASAFTPEEVEQLLAGAARRAIEYCKQRNIGVPPDRSSLACEGQLAVKIDRMKPRYRIENEQRVREVLVLLGQGFRAAAETAIAGLSLPLLDHDIQVFCQQSIKDASQRYDALVGPHRGGHLYRDARGQMQSDIQTVCDKIYRINAEKVSVILNRAKDAYRSAYERAITQEGCGQSLPEEQDQVTSTGLRKPCSTNRLAEISKTAQVEAQAAFDDQVKQEGLPWLGSGVEQYDFQNYQCLQWSKQRFAEFQAQNEASLQTFCTHQAASLVLQYKEQAAKISPFPDNDEVLTTKTNDLEKIIVDEYTTLVKEYLPSFVADEKKKELVRTISDLKAHYLRKNTALMRAFCYDPLQDAYRELRMQDCERSYTSIWTTKPFWSRKCLWPGPKYTFGFKYAAYVAARKHLEMAQSASKPSSSESLQGVVLSVTSRNKVIESWIEHDLASHGHVVFVNFTILVALAVVLFTCFASLFSKIVGFRNRVSPRASSPASAFRHARNGERFRHDHTVKNEGIQREGFFGAQRRPQKRWTRDR